MGCTEKLENDERCGQPGAGASILGYCWDHLPKDRKYECGICGTPLTVGVASTGERGVKG